eukprot:Gb_12327 [translate_table: standard]
MERHLIPSCHTNLLIAPHHLEPPLHFSPARDNLLTPLHSHHPLSHTEPPLILYMNLSLVPHLALPLASHTKPSPWNPLFYPPPSRTLAQSDFFLSSMISLVFYIFAISMWYYEFAGNLFCSTMCSHGRSFSKTGKLAVMLQHLKPKQYPDFMVKEDIVSSKSEKLLGVLNRKIKDMFGKESTEEAKASAWYHVTYNPKWVQKAMELKEPDDARAPILSIPWIAVDYLAQIKMRKLRADANYSSAIRSLASFWNR